MEPQKPIFKPHTVEKEDNLQYDLGFLTASDPNPIDNSEFGQNPGGFLLNLARDNTQLLFNRIFSLETEILPAKLGIGRVAILPQPTTLLPREKPLPQKKEATKWEKFAALKGIHKRKRSKMVLDEATGTEKRRYGYGRANDPKKADEWLIEAKPDDRPGEDPWAKLKKERDERVAENEKKEKKKPQGCFWIQESCSWCD